MILEYALFQIDILLFIMILEIYSMKIKNNPPFYYRNWEAENLLLFHQKSFFLIIKQMIFNFSTINHEIIKKL